MTTTALAAKEPAMPALSPEEKALLNNDLSGLNVEQRASLIMSVCHSLGLNPLTQPFQYVTLNSKLTLYARKDATDQLRALHDISVEFTSRSERDGYYFVIAKASTPSGRIDESMGAIMVKGLQGEAYCNALMKGETKAKRRVTLSICGLGFLDETEVDSIKEVGAAEIKYASGGSRRESLHNALAARNGQPAIDAQRELEAELRGMKLQQVAEYLLDFSNNNGISQEQFTEVSASFGGTLNKTNAVGIYARLKSIVAERGEAAALSDPA